jgi:hypothetical protein
MVLNQYFGSIGGLFSMWFGISLFDMVLILCRSLSYSVQRIGIQSFHWIKALIRFRFLRKIIKIFLIVVFSALTLIQISDVIQSYLEFKTITRFDVTEKQIKPRIVFGLIPILSYESVDRLIKSIQKKSKIMESKTT